MKVDQQRRLGIVATFRKQRLVGHSSWGRLRGQVWNVRNVPTRDRGILRLGQELWQQAVAVAIHIVVVRIGTGKSRKRRVGGCSTEVAGPRFLTARHLE